MKWLSFLVLSFLSILYSCSSDEDQTNFVRDDEGYNWTIPDETLTGSFNPFSLAKDPVLTRVSEVNSISDASLVAMVSFGNEIRVYPYQYISKFESVNDVIDGKNIAMTYCPITKSGLCIDRNFKGEVFTLRASGYLHNDNVILYDEKSDTFWSQMKGECINGKYAGATIGTYNFIETTWKTVKENFKNALVFTNTSIANNKSDLLKRKDGDIEKSEKVFGYFGVSKNINREINIYRYKSFASGIQLFPKNSSGSNIITIGSEDKNFITSYVNEKNVKFTAIQNQFPIVMEDQNSNVWNVFGIAVSGPRKGDQLESPISFVASWWAWDVFYDDFIFTD
ncbi:MAG: DUF3179 domain-containing (seleno)protein [Bacteroidota bacterium]